MYAESTACSYIPTSYIPGNKIPESQGEIANVDLKNIFGSKPGKGTLII